MNGAAPLVLVVDDEAELRDLLADVLALEGYQVLTAANGFEGRLLLDLCVPDLVLLDLQMPGWDGPSLVRSLQAEGSPVPVVLMSGAMHGRATADALGVDGFLAKPFELESLLRMVGQLSGARRVGIAA